MGYKEDTARLQPINRNNMDKEKWYIGEIKFFNEDRGFGFVDCWDDKKEYFVHITKIKTQPVKEADYVIFQLAPSKKKAGTSEAKNLSLLVKFSTDYDFYCQLFYKYKDQRFQREIINNLSPEEVLRLYKDGIESFSNSDFQTHFTEFREQYKLFINHPLDEVVVKDLRDATNSFLKKNVAENFLFKLWLENFYTDTLDEKLVLEFFTKAEKKLKAEIFLKVTDSDIKQKLIKNLIENEAPEEVFQFVHSHLKNVNGINYTQSKVTDSGFWNDKIDYHLYKQALAFIEVRIDLPKKLELYEKGFIKEIESNEITSSSHCFSLQELQFIFKNLVDKEVDKILLLQKYLLELPKRIEDFETSYFPKPPGFFHNQEEENNWYDVHAPPPDPEFWEWYDEQPLKYYQDFLKFANGQVDEAEMLKIQHKVINDQPEFHFDLWTNGLIQEVPFSSITNFFLIEMDFGKKIQEWLQKKRMSRLDIMHILASNLENFEVIKNRESFYVFNQHLEELLGLEQNLELLETRISQENISLFHFSSWIFGRSDYFNFEEYKNKLVFLSNEHQIIFLKKLFWLAHQQKFDLTIKKLDELTRIDYNLYKLNQQHNPEIPLDISVHVVIESLKAYSVSQKFLMENDMLKLVLKNLTGQKEKEFQLRGLFEGCRGRTEMKFNWDRDGEISKEYYQAGKYYLGIHFSPGERVYGNRGTYQYVPNTSFERIKESVKELPGRKWNAEKQHWGVPCKYEEQVLTFAQENRFFINFEGSNYKNNSHLANIKVTEIPQGLSFCEGRLAKEKDNIFNKEFWWCHNQPCYQNCETIHKPEEWQKYTLLDFCLILGFDLNDGNRVGDFIEKGKYYQFISTINRFNRLLEKLSCSGCDSILHPVEDSHFAHYRVVRFHCEDQNCREFHKEIYLHHCLNGKCNSIIDSRVSKKCPNGLYICSNNECGCCCSHAMLNRRLQNLQATGGYIPPNLISSVQHKIGHQERAEHFCYDCGNEMEEISNENFRCVPCEITYDLTKNNFKRPHKHLQMNNGKKGISLSDDDERNHIF